MDINIHGNATNLKLYRDIGAGCGDEVLRVFKLVPNFWLTAKKDGVNYKSRYIFPVKFKIKRTGEISNKWKKKEEQNTREEQKLLESLGPFNYMDEMVISIIIE